MSLRPTALIFSGGVGHPFGETSPVLAEYLEEAGWDARIETALADVIAGLPAADLLVVNALYWSMTQDEKYAPLRERWATYLGDEEIHAIDRFVRGGGALLVMHTGTICWDTQPLWREIMGGGWQWGRSHHPPYGPIRVKLTAAGERISDGEAEFELVDEAYHQLLPSPDCVVLAECDLGEGRQPVAWLREYGSGRVAVDALGHDVPSLTQPDHRALIAAQLNWLGNGRA
jgi:uncharacterized protein